MSIKQISTLWDKKKKIVLEYGKVGIVKLCAVLGAFGTSVILARFMGPKHYGEFTFMKSIFALGAIVGTLGTNRLVVRNIQQYKVKKNIVGQKSIWLYATSITITTVIVFSLCIAAVVNIFGVVGINRYFPVTIAVLCGCMFKVEISVLRGYKKVFVAEVFDTFLRRSIFIVLVATSIVVIEPIPQNIMLALAISYLLSYTVVRYRTRSIIPNDARWIDVTKKIEWAKWTYAALPMMGLGIITVVNNYVDKISIEILGSSEDLGRYQVSYLVAKPFLISSSVIQSVLGPRIAEMYERGESGQISNICSTSTRCLVLLLIPLVLLIFLFSTQIISLVYGSSYLTDGPVLPVLSFGFLAFAATGPTSQVLLMTNNEGKLMTIGITGVIINIVMNYILIKVMGIMGAALATVIALTSQSFLMLYFSIAYLSIDPSILGIKNNKKSW